MNARPGARLAYAATSVLALVTVVVVLVIAALNLYPPVEPAGNVYGVTPPGLAGVALRVTNTLSYFTVWSNIVVGVLMALLARGRGLTTPVMRALALDALMMITVTAIVYALLLAPTATMVGLQKVTNPVQHIVVPALTVLVWLIWGPRARYTLRDMARALVLPVVWLAYALGRGAVDGTYPYAFLDVGTHGPARVAATVAGIIVFGVVLMGLIALVERVVRPRADRSGDRM